MPHRNVAERTLEHGLFASRWLMAPMYLGLVVTLAMLMFIFIRELLHYVPQVMEMSPEKTILMGAARADPRRGPPDGALAG